MIIKIVSFIIVFTVIILAHEIGHFVFSRLAGIRVLELGMGLGPRIFGVLKDKTKYTLNLLPIGGFVRIAGLDEDTTDKNESFTPKESYLTKRPGQKFLAIFGGPLFNMLLAAIIFYFMFIISGVPSGTSNEIDIVTPASAAQKVGIMSGDRILKVEVKKNDLEKAIDKFQDDVKKILSENGTNNNIEDTEGAKGKSDIIAMIGIIHNNPGKTIIITLDRNGKEIKKTVIPKLNSKLGIGLIGISLKSIYIKTDPIRAVYLCLKQLLLTSISILYVLGLLIVGKVSLFDLAGPVGIAQFTGQVAGEGIVPLLYFTAYLSINLGLINLLPIPALDGGRLVFIIIEWIRKKAVDPILENKIHQVGFALLLAILALVTVSDVIKIFAK